MPLNMNLNLWLRISIFCLLLLVSVNGGFSLDVEEGFKSIFNGKDLTGWDGDPRFWSVEDGAITGRTTEENPAKKNTFLIWNQGEVDDFELRLSYKIVNGNSGIQIRSQRMDGWMVGGYQADMESGDRWTGALYDEHGRGPLALRGQKTIIDEDGEKHTQQIADPDELLSSVNKEGWNTYSIVARGNHLIQIINGRVMSEVIDNQSSENERAGILALQIHTGPPMTVQFKNIRLKRFDLKNKKKVVMVAGKQSHGHGAHEHNAGVLLLKKCLDELPETINAAYLDGWPDDPTAFDNADTILQFSDGGGRNPMIQKDRLQKISKLMDEGTGLVIIHYAVEVPKDRGGPEFLKWIGGYYETGYSTNPHWKANFETIPEHPVTRGVEPFSMQDEWYYNMRFRPGMEGVIPLLKAVPPDNTRRTEAAQKHPGRAEIVAWCVERPDGGRGFGFTGGHFHKNWGNDDFRTIVLNAIYWTAHLEVPKGGVPSSISPEFLKKNLDMDRRQ